MKCVQCGSDLIQGNNICPSCGKDNTPVEQTNITPENIEMPQMSADTNNNDAIIDLDEGPAEVVQASEDMSAPKLELEQEVLTNGAHDISKEENVSTYDPTQDIPQDENVNLPKEAQVNFQLPEVKEAGKDTQGMDILQINSDGKTVGEVVPPEKKKFSLNLKIFTTKTFSRKFVIIAVVIALLIGGVIGSLVFGKQVYTPGTAKTTKKATVKHVSDGKNNVTYVGNYIYKIPTDFDYDRNNGGVIIYSQSDDYRIFMKSIKGNYEHVANAKESIKKSLENIGITVSSIVETVIQDNRYIVVEASYGIHNRLYAFRQGNNDDLFYVEILAAENRYDYDALNIANDIISNAEYNTKYTNMESASYEDVSAIAVTAAEAINNG